MPRKEHTPLDDLSPKHKAFVISYTSPHMRFNAKRAYMAAYAMGDDEGNKAGVLAWMLLKKPAIQAAVNYILDQRAQNYEEVGKMVINELMTLAFYNPAEMFDKDGQPLKPLDLPDHMQMTIKGYKNTERGLEVTLSDKLKALDILAKAIGMTHDTRAVVVDSYEQMIERIKNEDLANKSTDKKSQ